MASELVSPRSLPLVKRNGSTIEQVPIISSTAITMGFLNLPPELRNMIYEDYFGDNNLIEASIQTYDFYGTDFIVDNQNAFRTTVGPSLALLRTSRIIFQEASALLRARKWSLVLQNCSINHVGTASSIICNALPDWIYANTSSLRLVVTQHKLCEDDDAFVPIGTGNNSVLPYDDMCLLQLVPLSKFQSLVSCHIDVKPVLKSIRATHNLASQELEAISQSRRTLYGRLRLELSEIVQHGGACMKDVDFTATTQTVVEDSEKTLWKMEFKPAMSETNWETWVPVKKWQKLESQKDWTEADFEPNQWLPGVSYHYVMGVGIFPQVS